MTEQRTPLVELKNISISFGGIHAVDNASVDLYPGEVVALLGHNGAGKSTLIKILSGAYKRDSGDILINGEPADIRNPRDAKKYGIETIYQTLAVADNVDAAANSQGTTYELYTIAAAVIGCTSLAGGTGTIAGAMLGALVMQSLQSGMGLANVDTPIQNVVVGAVLVIAVWLDTVYRSRAK